MNLPQQSRLERPETLTSLLMTYKAAASASLRPDVEHIGTFNLSFVSRKQKEKNKGIQYWTVAASHRMVEACVLGFWRHHSEVERRHGLDTSGASAFGWSSCPMNASNDARYRVGFGETVPPDCDVVSCQEEEHVRRTRLCSRWSGQLPVDLFCIALSRRGQFF